LCDGRLKTPRRVTAAGGRLLLAVVGLHEAAVGPLVGYIPAEIDLGISDLGVANGQNLGVAKPLAAHRSREIEMNVFVK
jgi:hypothetical protein